MADTTRRTTRTSLQVHSTSGNLFAYIQVAFSSPTYYFLQEHNTSSVSSSLHAPFAFILSVLVSFLQLNYVGKDTSPFETHPKSVGMALFSLLIYYFAYKAHLGSESSSSHRRSTAYAATIARRGMELFGSLALVSLASILLVDSFVPVLYLVCVLVLAGKLVLYSYPLRMPWNWIYRIIPRGFQGRLVLCSYPLQMLWNWLHRIISRGFQGQGRGPPLAFSNTSVDNIPLV